MAQTRWPCVCFEPGIGFVVGLIFKGGSLFAVEGLNFIAIMMVTDSQHHGLSRCCCDHTLGGCRMAPCVTILSPFCEELLVLSLIASFRTSLGCNMRWHSCTRLLERKEGT